MARRKQAPKRDILPDPLFRSTLLTKFMNVVMISGKKSISEKIVYGALNSVLQKLQTMAKQAKSDQIGGEGDEGGSRSGGGILVSDIKRISGDIRADNESRGLALKVFEKALDSVSPAVEVRSRRVGGSTYQVPVEVRSDRRLALAMRWLVEYAAKRSEKTMAFRLAGEILDAIEGRGGAVEKRKDVHRMAKANQAFAHYRW